MPFLEFIFALFAIALGIVALAFIATVYVSAAAIAIGITLALGWIPILMCATDIHLNIGTGAVGNAALIATIAYSLCSAVLIGVMIVRPDPDGLPPAWKFLALFYKAREGSRMAGAQFDARSFANFRPVPMGNYAKRMWASVYDHGRAKMTARRTKMETETAQYLDKMRLRAEEAEKLYRAQARRNTARDWMDENDGRETKAD